MSLIRQIWLLLLATLVVAFLASVTVTVGAARDTLQTQLRLKNSDNATALAQVLSQQKGEPGLMEMAAAAQFDTGYYRLIRYTGADGRVVFERQGTASPAHAPAWFVAGAPIESAPGVAQVSDGWRALGRIEVVSQAAYAYDELWRGSVQAAAALGVVGVLAGLFALLAVGRIRRPLDETVEQAMSLQRGEYLTVTEPQVPELRRLTQAMNSMVARLRTVFEAQAAQVEGMRRQVSCDALTGLPNRTQFLARLGAALQREDGDAEGGLVLLRMLRLAELNRTLGRLATDELITVVGTTLQAWAEGVPGSHVGRLNGSDFALTLARGDVASRSAADVIGRLRVALAAAVEPIAVVAGAVEMRHGMALAALMGAADLALAQAESAGPYTVQAGATVGDTWLAAGERGWRERVQEALLAGRSRLASFPVVDAKQRLLHLECPLRLQLEPDGPFEVAARWLPLAIRSHLIGAADERALSLALEDIAHDGQPRCVNLSPAALADSGYAARLRGVLQAMPRQARLVWIEIAESAAVDHFELVRELGRQLRPTGARFGLEHAGERLSRIERLFEAGLDYVKLDAAIGHGVADDAARAGFVKGLVTLLRGLSLQVIVEGVTDERDVRVLFGLGVDGVTGPWVRVAPP